MILRVMGAQPLLVVLLVVGTALGPLLLDGKGDAVLVIEMVLLSLGWDEEQQVLAEVLLTRGA